MTLQPRKGSLERPVPQSSTDDPRVMCALRTSTRHQHYGLKAQRDALQNFADTLHLTITGIYPEQISAKERPFLKRDSVKQMLTDMEEQGITQILISKVDRAFRSTADFLVTCTKLEELGIRLRTADTDMDFGTPTGRLVMGILAQLGEWELRMRSERQLAAFEVMRQENKPCGGVIRYGWTLDPDNPAKLKPVTQEQLILREIISLYEAGQTPKDIARILKARGTIKTFRRLTKTGLQTKTTTWTHRGITAILEHATLAPTT